MAFLSKGDADPKRQEQIQRDNLTLVKFKNIRGRVSYTDKYHADKHVKRGDGEIVEIVKEFTSLKEYRHYKVDGPKEAPVTETTPEVAPQEVTPDFTAASAPVETPEEPKEEQTDLQALREEYKEVTGRNPFNGWNAEQLSEKISNAK